MSKPGDIDISLINMNLMYAKQQGELDNQNYIPLGLLYLAGYLQEKSFLCEINDYQLVEESDPFQVETFLKFNGELAEFVGLSCMANLLPFTIICAKALKALYPNIKIILGGVGPSPVAKEIINSFNFIDYVVIGEGEKALLDILNGKSKSGIVKTDVIESLDDLPFPAYNLLDISKYDAAPSIITSRGCSYKCAFCTEPFNFRRSPSFRSNDNIINEIRNINEMTGKTMFLFQDDNFILNKSRFKDFCETLQQLEFKINWKSFCRVDVIDEEILRWAKESGCVQLRFGIESGSDFVLNELNKGFTIKNAYNKIHKVLKYIPSVHTSFMWGFPFESKLDLKRTIKWMKKFEDIGSTILLFQYAPLAGTPLYEKYKDNLEFVNIHYSNFVLTGHEVRWRPLNFIEHKHQDIFEFIKKYPKIFPGFYCIRYEENILPKLKILLKSEFILRRTLRNKYDL